MSITDVPSAILLVFAATKASVSNGSNTIWPSTGRLPSGLPGYGVCGFNGHRSLSKRL